MTEKKAIIIKKYPNRRLYNTSTSSYITLEDLSKMVKNEEDFIVIDAKNNSDLTRLVLTQIILEHETRGYDMLPIELLKQIIKFYDDEFANIFRSYLLFSLEHFNQNRENVQSVLGIFSEKADSIERILDKGMQQFIIHNEEWIKMVKKMNPFNNQK